MFLNQNSLSFFQGSGTRTGDGTCECDKGYAGRLCDVCAARHYTQFIGNDILCVGKYRYLWRSTRIILCYTVSSVGKNYFPFSLLICCKQNINTMQN